jgi:IS5 family transposase
LVQVQEAENQIITHYDVFDHRPSDRELLADAVDAQIDVLGRVPDMVTADAGYYSQALENAVLEKGVKRVAVPNRNTRSVERKKKEHSRWFRNAQRWRTGCEGRIRVLKRRHGLSRCRYRGAEGLKRWVGLGITADTLSIWGRRWRCRRNAARHKRPGSPSGAQAKMAIGAPLFHPVRHSGWFRIGHFAKESS